VRKPGVKACWPRPHGELPQLGSPVHSQLVPNDRASLSPESLPPDASTQQRRAAAVKGAMQHAWGNYKKLAWGRDNLQPISGRGADGGFHHAVTMVDSLDTLWLMGMKNEFEEAKQWLVQNLPGRIDTISSGASVFETTIRSLGGLLSAYDLSKDKAFLSLSTKLANKLLQATNTEGITTYTFSGGSGGMGCNSLAESGTNQLEMRYLAHVTGDAHFSAKVDKFYDHISTKSNLDGLYPNCFDRGSGKITFGADGDSFYEYLIKAWLQGGRKEDRLWNLYNKAVDGLEKWLVHKGSDGLTYLSNVVWQGGSSVQQDHAMEHLTCFVPGWLVLGAKYQTDPARKKRHESLAEKIAYTCYQMYAQQPTGIGPERVKGMRMDLSLTDTREYILRPEAVEGFWYMFLVTKNPKYREWGWQIFQNFEKWLRVEHGYASLRDVSSPRKQYLDRMESFFLAETLKYLYLLQDSDSPINLEDYVLNTEAHPLSVFGRPNDPLHVS